jgi:small subunit ribosomal protein S8
MSCVDPRADFLTQIRNALVNRSATIKIPSSKFKADISEVMKKQGYINDYKIIEEKGGNKYLKIELKYGPADEDVIHGLELKSKQGKRMYVKKDEIPYVMGGYGIAILSTSKGLMSCKEARKAGMGGEVICYIW